MNNDGRAGGGAVAEMFSSREMRVLAATCVTFGIVGWGFWLLVFHGEPAQDWMVFYTASRAYFDGNLPLLFDGNALTAALNQRFAGWLGLPLGPHPWVYPPTFLLLFLPFGMLPAIPSLILFLLSGFILLAVTAALYVGGGSPRRITLLSLVLCPAVPFNVLTGQNAFFTGAVLVGGFGLLRRAPVAAGALLGLLSVKPQLALMVPVALLAARQWRALAGAAASALMLAVLSLVVVGPAVWRQWLLLMTNADEAFRAWVTAGRLNGVSVFACASHLGATPVVANLLQAIAIATAAAAVYWAFRRGIGAAPLAVLLAATILAAPHASNSDAVLLALATALFVSMPRSVAPSAASAGFAAAVWVSPLFGPPSLSRFFPIFFIGTLAPLLILLLIAAIIAEIRAQGAPAALEHGA